MTPRGRVLRNQVSLIRSRPQSLTPGHTDRHKTVSCQAPLLLHRKNQRQQISEGVIFPAIDVDIYRYRSVGGLGRWLQRLIVGMVGPVPA